jgi:hypothetical protein
MAQEFMAELGKCEIIAVKILGDTISLHDSFSMLNIMECAAVQVNALDGNRSVSPDDWAADVNKELKENGGGNMSFVTGLANYYLIHLVIACGRIAISVGHSD